MGRCTKMLATRKSSPILLPPIFDHVEVMEVESNRSDVRQSSARRTDEFCSFSLISVWPSSADPSQRTTDGLTTDRRILFFLTESVWPAVARSNMAGRKHRQSTIDIESTINIRTRTWSLVADHYSTTTMIDLLTRASRRQANYGDGGLLAVEANGQHQHGRMNEVL